MNYQIGKKTIEKQIGSTVYVEMVNGRWFLTTSVGKERVTVADFSFKDAARQLVTEVLRKLRYEIGRKQNWRCANCGEAKPLELHHVVPLSKGGTHRPENLICVCRECHESIQYKDYRAGALWQDTEQKESVSEESEPKQAVQRPRARKGH